MIMSSEHFLAFMVYLIMTVNNERKIPMMTNEKRAFLHFSFSSLSLSHVRTNDTLFLWSSKPSYVLLPFTHKWKLFLKLSCRETACKGCWKWWHLSLWDFVSWHKKRYEPLPSHSVFNFVYQILLVNIVIAHITA